MKKRGLSGVVTTLILVGLAVVAAGIVWVMVTGIINSGKQGVESCFGNMEKVALNDRFTCYDSSSKEFNFALEIGDVEVEKILVSMANQGGSKSLELLEEGSTYNYLRTYSGSYGDSVRSPNKNSGRTYVVNATILDIEGTSSVKIAPFIDGNQCDVSDSLLEIVDCALIA